jgi:hypothetical protein
MKQSHISWRSWRLGGEILDVSRIATFDRRVPVLITIN